MSKPGFIAALLFTAAVGLASCGSHASVDRAQAPEQSASTTVGPFKVAHLASFAEPWAAAIEPGTGNVFVTEQAGTIKFYRPETGRIGTVSGAPAVDYGGQGGLGDIAFAPDYKTSKAIYLSWVEAGEGDTRGAVVGRGQLGCSTPDACTISGLEIIWRQSPKVTGRGHYSHRIAFSPDSKFLFIASGERQKMAPAQDVSNNLGSVVRLNLDGTPAAGNPMAANEGASPQIWSYGHRNILGLKFDMQGRLWDLEHGPAGGDELNLVTPGANYGWPLVSEGSHYGGKAIPAHATRPEFAAPAISWTPVIAPGDFIFYSGAMFTDWRGDALIAGLKAKSIIRVKVEGERASEVARYDMGQRIREIVEAPDGAIYLLEDGEDGRLLHLSPATK